MTLLLGEEFGKGSPRGTAPSLSASSGPLPHDTHTHTRPAWPVPPRLHTFVQGHLPQLGAPLACPSLLAVVPGSSGGRPLCPGHSARGLLRSRARGMVGSKGAEGTHTGALTLSHTCRYGAWVPSGVDTLQ